MDYYLFSAQNATIAQRMAQILQNCGVESRIQRMPSVLAQQGCGFALRISPEKLLRARECLKLSGILSKHVYLRENGVYREVTQ